MPIPRRMFHSTVTEIVRSKEPIDQPITSKDAGFRSQMA